MIQMTAVSPKLMWNTAVSAKGSTNGFKLIKSAGKECNFTKLYIQYTERNFGCRL